MGRRWTNGDVILRREVLGLSPLGPTSPSPPWSGKPWLVVPVVVVEDSDDALVTYLPTGAEFGCPDGHWPIENGRHPWRDRRAWSGHGTLMVQRPGEHHAVWHFWIGPERSFACWYINLQTAFERTGSGYDTQDLELDIVVLPDGTWTVKDLELLEVRVAEGRFSPELVAWIEALGEQLVEELAAGRPWWDDRWREWEPDPGWGPVALPPGWDA